MSNLAFAYRGLGQYADAHRVGDEAVKLEVATAPTRRLLYQLGIMMNDGSAAAQIEWSKSVPREFDLISAQAQVASFEGRLRDSATLYGRAADLATARSLSGTASGFWAHLAMTEAFYEDPRRATERVRDDCGAHGQRCREPRDDPAVQGRRRARPRRARNRRTGARLARPPAVSGVHAHAHRVHPDLRGGNCRRAWRT